MAKLLSKKTHFQNQELEKFYKLIYKYNLREIAYKKLLQFYIEFHKTKKIKSSGS